MLDLVVKRKISQLMKRYAEYLLTLGELYAIIIARLERYR